MAAVEVDVAVPALILIKMFPVTALLLIKTLRILMAMVKILLLGALA